MYASVYERSNQYARIALLCAGGALLAAGTHVVLGGSHKPAVRLTPRVHTVAKPAFEGETLKIPFQVINDGDESVTVNDIKVTCGCLSIKTENEKFSPPLRIGPSDSLPLIAELSTNGRSGSQLQRILVQCDVAGVPWDFVGEIQYVVRHGLKPYPNRLFLEEVERGETASGVILLSDARPNANLDRLTVTTGHDKALAAELRSS